MALNSGGMGPFWLSPKQGLLGRLCLGPVMWDHGQDNTHVLSHHHHHQGFLYRVSTLLARFLERK